MVVARRKLTAAIDRGDVRVCRELFESYWERFVTDRRHTSPPAPTSISSRMGENACSVLRRGPPVGYGERIREWLAAMVELG